MHLSFDLAYLILLSVNLLVCAGHSAVPAAALAPATRAPVATTSKPLFVIFDPRTGRQLDPLQYPPIKWGRRRAPNRASGKLVELPRLWSPCTCSYFLCMCCLGLRFGENFSQRVCLSLEYNAAQVSLQVRVHHNERPIADFDFAAHQQTSFCLPMLLPLPVLACLRLRDITTHDGDVQLCTALVLSLPLNQPFQFNFDCLRFGLNGVQFVKAPASTVGSDDVTWHNSGDRQDLQLGDQHHYNSIPADSAQGYRAAQQPLQPSVPVHRGRLI